jgi:hypothetical protein
MIGSGTFNREMPTREQLDRGFSITGHSYGEPRAVMYSRTTHRLPMQVWQEYLAWAN